MKPLTTCPRCGTYTTAPTHCGADVTVAAVCTCGCRATDHAYRAATKRNSGRCLQRACGCGSYEEVAQNPHGIKGKSAPTWDNVASPQGALTPAGSDPLTRPIRERG